MFHTVAKTTSKSDKHFACNHALQELTIKILPTCERILLNFLCQDFLDTWHSLCHRFESPYLGDVITVLHLLRPWGHSNWSEVASHIQLQLDSQITYRRQVLQQHGVRCIVILHTWPHWNAGNLQKVPSHITVMTFSSRNDQVFNSLSAYINVCIITVQLYILQQRAQ